MRRHLWMSWYFGGLRGLKCWPRLGHRWLTTYGCGDPACKWCFTDTRCERCGVERGWTRTWILWGTPLLWRVSWRVKHGAWPEWR